MEPHIGKSAQKKFNTFNLVQLSRFNTYKSAENVRKKNNGENCCAL